ncbi:polyprenyl synthetase family protein [Streptomyces celluloflavus]|uniref:polyprenyl synthetase family protein n=1 Tax=Streptomyces celluloflavus TaxID=58344 RepID=UPI0036736628
MPTPASTPLDLPLIREQVDACLTGFLTGKIRTAARQGFSQEIPEIIAEFIGAGGKRLRPLLCVVGWHAAGGPGRPLPLLRTAAALEMFHASALIHDDIMDRSETRHRHPTVHHMLTHRHAGGRAPEWFGISAAIMAGDMALVWSDELLNSAGLSPARLATARSMVDAMREEVIHGQFLDLLAPLGPGTDLDAAWHIILHKTARYTIEYPLRLGAALAGAERALHAALTRFAIPVGEAFQLRDDLLGVFGDPVRTGKPVLDDLREGKHTVLLTLAAQRADRHQRDLLERLIGDPHLDEDDAARVRAVLQATGAHTTVEGLITDRYEKALTALGDAPCPPSVTDALRDIARRATERSA